MPNLGNLEFCLASEVKTEAPSVLAACRHMETLMVLCNFIQGSFFHIKSTMGAPIHHRAQLSQDGRKEDGAFGSVNLFCPS